MAGMNHPFVKKPPSKRFLEQYKYSISLWRLQVVMFDDFGAGFLLLLHMV
jgi:hypothetical protein